MCDEDVDDFLATLKCFHDCFVISKMVEKFRDALLANNYFYEDHHNKSSFMSDLWLDVIKFEKRKAFKKYGNKELMPVAWHPKRCWNWCFSSPIFGTKIHV